MVMLDVMKAGVEGRQGSDTHPEVLAYALEGRYCGDIVRFECCCRTDTGDHEQLWG